MKINWIYFLFLWSLLAAFQFGPAHAQAPEATAAQSANQALVIEMRSTIGPATSQFLARAIQEATDRNSLFLLIELDTPGGLVSSTREMAQSISQSTVPVVVYVSPAGAAATSAGALLMISSHVAAMAPGTNIGAAHPVGGQGEDIPGAAGEKAANDVAAFARGMAKLRGRNVEASSRVVLKSESFSSEEALRAKLIEIVAPDREALVKSLDQRKVTVGTTQRTLQVPENVEFQRFEMRPGEQLLQILAHPNVAALLMTLGLILIYAELSAPGLGIPGIAGALCFIIAFMSFQALPIRTGGLVLIALGAALIISEVFVGFSGILAGGGLVCFLLGLLWVMDPDASDLRISPFVYVLSAGTLLLGGGLIALAAARTRALSNRAMQETKGGGLAGLLGYVGVVDRVEADGHHGKIQIRGEIWNCVSDSPLTLGEEVKVLESEGLNVKVSPVRKGF